MISAICQKAKDSLGQILAILYQLDSRQYTQNLAILQGKSIGSHCRHSIAFFLCFSNSVKMEEFSYDDRERSINLEENLDLMIECIQAQIQFLEELKLENNFGEEVMENNSIRVRNYLGEYLGWVVTDSTWGRELIYLIDHTVHHLAILRIALQENFPAVIIPETFGFTESTLLVQKV